MGSSIIPPLTQRATLNSVSIDLCALDPKAFGNAESTRRSAREQPRRAAQLRDAALLRDLCVDLCALCDKIEIGIGSAMMSADEGLKSLRSPIALRGVKPARRKRRQAAALQESAPGSSLRTHLNLRTTSNPTGTSGSTSVTLWRDRDGISDDERRLAVRISANPTRT
jgi:hypothetical protein